MSITPETLRLQDELEAQLGRHVDAQDAALIRAWAGAWDDIAPELRAALLEQLVAGERVTRSQLLRSQRLRKALVVMADALHELARRNTIQLTGALRDLINVAGEAQASVIDSQIPANAGGLVDLDAWSRVDARQVDAIVRRSTQQITSRMRPLPREVGVIVRRELIRGVAVGANPRATADRMLARARRAGFELGANRARVIARTETLDAHRAAAALGQALNADVLGGWVWSAALTARTCPACLSMHGREFPLTEPGPLGHPQCRCARVPVVKPLSQLVPELADLDDDTGTALPDAADFFGSLPPESQRDILGPSRYAAWSAGTFPMDSWATRRSATDWRDSYVVAPAPQNSGGRSAPRAA